ATCASEGHFYAILGLAGAKRLPTPVGPSVALYGIGFSSWCYAPSHTHILTTQETQLVSNTRDPSGQAPAQTWRGCQPREPAAGSRGGNPALRSRSRRGQAYGSGSAPGIRLCHRLPSEPQPL